MHNRITTAALLIVLSAASCLAQQLPEAPSYSSSLASSTAPHYMLGEITPGENFPAVHEHVHHNTRKAILFGLGGAVVVGAIVAITHSGSAPANQRPMLPSVSARPVLSVFR